MNKKALKDLQEKRNPKILRIAKRMMMGEVGEHYKNKSE